MKKKHCVQDLKKIKDLVQEIVDRCAECLVLRVIQHIKGHGIDLFSHPNTDEHSAQSNCVGSPRWKDEYMPVSCVHS